MTFLNETPDFMKYHRLFAIFLGVLLITGCEESSTSPNNPSEEEEISEDGSDGNNKNNTDTSSVHFNDSTIGCNSAKEVKLFNKINEYRKKHNLSKIDISQKLTTVADAHVRDLNQNKPHENSEACNLHSWSDNGPWTACCYTDDHAQTSCMWDKPGELTTYSGNGYEISYGAKGIEVTPKSALEAWKDSESHNKLMLNKGQWENLEWNAMGISLKGDYAVVWFGEKADSSNGPAPCDE